MRKLQQSETQRFEKVCKTIRMAMHLDHLEREYSFKKKDTRDPIAAAHIYAYGWRLKINVYPEFWKANYELQVRYLIHEHVHVCLLPLHQSTFRVIERWVASHDESQVDELTRTAGEISVDHLTEVFYQLLKDRL